jgi:hypothetical protein
MAWNEGDGAGSGEWRGLTSPEFACAMQNEGGSQAIYKNGPGLQDEE